MYVSTLNTPIQNLDRSIPAADAGPPPGAVAHANANADQLAAVTEGSPRTVTVLDGYTLFGIAQRHRKTPDTDICQVAVALWQRNPDAFENNDMNRLKPGAELVLPTEDAARAIAAAEARRICGAHIDPDRQKAHGTADLKIRNSFEEQRPLNAGDLELVYFGDTLGQIANRLNIPNATLNQKLVALMDANPEAFNRGNMNSMKTGVLLRMPSAERVLAIDAESAKATVTQQWCAHRQYADPTRKC